MTADPVSLADGLDEALDGWAAPARERLPAAIFCAAAHPFDEAILCRRLDGHSGAHQSDGQDAWRDPEESV